MSNVYFDLSSSNFAQDWTNTGLIAASDDWSGVPSIIGYRGDNLSTAGIDPQTVLASDTPGVVDVNANQTTLASFTTGGVTEFELTGSAGGGNRFSVRSRDNNGLSESDPVQ